MSLEHQEPHPTRAEHRRRGGAFHHREAEHIAVEVGNGVQLADAHRHSADPHRRAVGESRSRAASISLGARRRGGGRGE